MQSRILVLAIAAALAVFVSVQSDAKPAAKSVASVAAMPQSSAKSAQLDKLYADFWEESLKLNPLQATFVGDPRYNDQLPNVLSPDYRAQTHTFNTQWLAKAKAIGSDGLSGQALLSYDIFVRDLHDQLDGEHGDVHNQLEEEHAQAHAQGLDPYDHARLHQYLQYQHDYAHEQLERQHEYQHRLEEWRRRNAYYGYSGY